LQLKDKTPDFKDQLAWKWLKGAVTAKTDFGDPTAMDMYDLCLYDAGGIALTARIPAGGVCAKNKPCWKEAKTGFAYKDGALTPNGVEKLQLRAGGEAGKAKILVKGKGDLLQMPDLAALVLPVTVQLVNRGNGVCWQAVYSGALKQDETQFTAKGD
jgi:hypothetical protein